MKKVFLSQVTCPKDDCYQFVTEDFIKEHPKMEYITLFKKEQKT